MDNGVTQRPPPVCTGRGGRLFTCSLVRLHAPVLALPRWLPSSPATYVIRQVQKVARDAEMLRRVCEARRELGGCETLNGSQKSRIFRRVAGSLVPIVKVGCRSRTAASLRAVHVTAPPCFTEWLAPPGVHTSQNDCFARAPEVKIWSISLLTLTHGVGTANAPCILSLLHAPFAAPPRWLPASPSTRKRV